MRKFFEIFDYRHLIAAALVLGSLALCLFHYQYPVIRLIEACIAFGRAFAYSFLDLLKLSERFPIEQTVNSFSGVDLTNAIGFDIEALREKFTGLWDQIFVGENFLTYLRFLLFYLMRILYYTCFALLVVVLCAIPVILTWDDVDNETISDTLPLRLFKRFIARPCRIAWDWVKDFWEFFIYSGWRGLFILVWLVNVGALSILISFFAYYFWLLTSFDFSTIGVQLLKLAADLLLGLNTLPWFIWAPLFIWLYDRWRQAHGMDKLHHLDARNKGLLNEMPMCMFIVAPPRTGKDMLMTDMGITFAALDRDKALKTLKNNMKRFPRFPWLAFEHELQEMIREGIVRNWATARSWIDARRRYYMMIPKASHIWNYDVDVNAVTFNDNLKIITIWDALRDYAQAYFTYTLTTSYIISNYPVRDDFEIYDVGNFPLVDTNYLDRDPEYMDEDSKYSHIVDWDMFRLGRRVMHDNPNVGAFEFGIKLFTEIDKERKNMDQLKEVKAKDETCNQKNDLFNTDQKMSGHLAMLDNECYLHFLANAQRPSSWGADGNELCVKLHIEKHKDTCNTLPFFWLEEGIIGRYLSWWDGVYINARFKWANDRLITWLGQGLAALLYGYITRRRNLYGYYQQNMTLESGTTEEKTLDEKAYFVLFKKAYAERYASDYFRTFAEKKTERCAVSFNDLPTFSGKYPTYAELTKQNSHFNNDLFQYHEIEEQPSDEIDYNVEYEEFYH